jgi:hypothetical protein
MVVLVVDPLIIQALLDQVIRHLRHHPKEIMVVRTLIQMMVAVVAVQVLLDQMAQEPTVVLVVQEHLQQFQVHQLHMLAAVEDGVEDQSAELVALAAVALVVLDHLFQMF